MLSVDCLPKKKKNPLRKKITEEQKEEGLMALDKKDISGMGKSLPNMQSQIYRKKLQFFA